VEYGIGILHVQEIRVFETPTRIAEAPAHVLGVLNLRGLIVPVVDLRLRFGMADAGRDSRTALVVLNTGGRLIGLVVDGVSDVIALNGDQLRPVPEFGPGMAIDHLMAIGSVGQRMLVLIDICRLVASPETGLSAVTLS